MKVNWGLNDKKEIRYIGANFWIDNKIAAWPQVKPSIIWGNQKWKGAAPNFIIRERRRIKE